MLVIIIITIHDYSSIPNAINVRYCFAKSKGGSTNTTGTASNSSLILYGHYQIILRVTYLFHEYLCFLLILIKGIVYL